MLEDLKEPPRPLSSDSELRARIHERYLHCNVMVDEHNNITGILDWESAGWYPEYWEYAQIMRPAFWGDWSVWMEKTAPQRWDLGGINAARKVLF
ncbi:uncharacterized protein N7459_003463 [Penicillium hispanicum]|uniref:uncharacterized protein n=1 Tax=Penicillium hispanicum TaxID=1080232 RepID=UPI00253FCD8B|nr:uncharacterized protein N7459_003463 [Penicillium hispanicum]KAJ5587698.1 hypothetical protein N7459_003463 [Penicillium hispanicum]